eukprot:scaffold23281_cov120-Isochrysis_galbana.AAC.3
MPASTARRAPADVPSSPSMPKSDAISVVAAAHGPATGASWPLCEAATSRDASRFMAASTRQTASDALRFGMSAA